MAFYINILLNSRKKVYIVLALEESKESRFCASVGNSFLVTGQWQTIKSADDIVQYWVSVAKILSDPWLYQMLPCRTVVQTRN